MLLPHEVLGVSPDADLPTIKRAFRALVKEHHPDRSRDPQADARFRELMIAYRSLAHERAHHVKPRRTSSAWPSAMATAIPNVAFDDVSWVNPARADIATAYPTRLARIVVLGTLGAVALLWVSAFLSQL